MAPSLQPYQKNPQILEASGHCLFLGNSSKTDKVPLAFCKLKPFSFQNGNSLLHKCTQVLSLVIFATKAHFTSGLQLHLLEANFLPSLKIPSSHYTQVILQIQVWSKLFSLICLYTTLNLKSLFEHQKPTEDESSAVIQFKHSTFLSSCVHWSHRKFLGWRLEKVFKSLWTVSELLVWFYSTCPLSTIQTDLKPEYSSREKPLPWHIFMPLELRSHTPLRTTNVTFYLPLLT